MDLNWGDIFSSYWSSAEVGINFIIFLNLLGSMALGLVVGYERTYHGRAAGMRTYGLVCMASAALVVVAGYPHFWYGGISPTAFVPDPTRVIQGIVTGVGFLGAGVIMREGFNISGLTTAASIWASSAIGVLVGLGFYASAILLTALSAVSMMWISRLENWLPAKKALAVVLTFGQDKIPDISNIRRVMQENEYKIAEGSLSIAKTAGRQEWHFVVVDVSRRNTPSIETLSMHLNAIEGVQNFQISHARN